jgi:aminopeptidase N
VTLAVPPALVALSNMPAAAVAPSSEGLVRHSFQTTPPMSTYLLAFVVGALEPASSSCEVLSGQLPISVWATPDKKALLATALAAACAAVSAFEKALRQPYPLPKLDLVGIPNFGAGAMENWGLITYRCAAPAAEARLLMPGC